MSYKKTIMENATYPVFINKKMNKKLAFYPVKKNANTSSKFFFACHLGIENKFFFIEDVLPRFKQTKQMHANFKNKINLINWFQAKYKFTKINVDYKSCIVRNPLDRFVSAYKNRILFHQDKEFKDHSIDEVIDKLENGILENSHFTPQNYWLGKDLDYFDIIGNVSNIKVFEKKINDFFGKNIKFPRLQTGGKDFTTALNAIQIKKIKKIYNDDYDLLSKFI